MSLGVRLIQRRNFIGLQLLEGAEGLSEFDVTVGPSVDEGARTFALSTDASGVAPVNPQPLIVTQGVTDDGTTSPDFTLDIAAGQSIGSGWVTVLWMEHDGALGSGSFDIPLAITKAEDASGASILGSVVGPDLSYKHAPPSAAQAAEAPLLDDLLAPMGLSEGDDLGRRHYSEYEPSAPIGPFGRPDASIVNANLNDEEISAVIRVGFLSRGRGANAYRLFLTEAGRRSAGFSLAA